MHPANVLAHGEHIAQQLPRPRPGKDDHGILHRAGKSRGLATHDVPQTFNMLNCGSSSCASTKTVCSILMPRCPLLSRFSSLPAHYCLNLDAIILRAIRVECGRGDLSGLNDSVCISPACENISMRRLC